MPAIPLDATNSVIIQPDADGFPPLMVLMGDDTPVEECEATREAFRKSMRDRDPLLVCGDVKVFQLIDGRWRRLD